METQLTFRGAPSPANFDQLANTKDLLVCLASGTPKRLVNRALDDSPCVSSASSGVVERFSSEMRRLCSRLEILLAENCPLAEKAFELKTRGTVLGIGFYSSDMTWFLSEEKTERIIRRCKEVAGSVHVDLKQIQRLMGSVNDLGQIFPLVKFYKRSGNALLTQFAGCKNLLMRVPDELRDDLRIIAKIAETARSGLPIAEKPGQPPLSALSFYTDAAGASFSMVKGAKVFHDNKGRGVVCLAGTEVKNIWAWTRLEWPEALISGLQDEKGRLFGCKSTTLESVGLLLPLLAFLKDLSGKHIFFWVDNVAVLWGWNSGYVKMDRSATELLKSVKYVAGYLGVTVL